MAYTIYNNDGTILLNLPDSEVDEVTTSLSLIGKNVNNYGQYFNNNLVKLLTSFANTAGNEPVNPQPGQLFFNKSTKKLTVYNGVSFYPTNGSYLSQPLSPTDGDFWFNTVEDQLFIWTGTNYKLVGPALPRSAGKFGIEPSTATITTDVTYAPQPSVGLIYAYNSAVGMISTTSFKMSTTTSILYLSTSTATQLVAGLTLFQNLDVKGSTTLNSYTYAYNTIFASQNIILSNAASPNAYVQAPYLFATKGISVYATDVSYSTNSGALQVVGGVGIGGSLNVGESFKQRSYTVTTLPTGSLGMRAFVSDSNTSTFYSLVGSGGSFKVPVFHDGISWRIG